ncbi:ABC transporter substrate-binding protein [Caldilinea sp.]|jgi:branched-chain amino acid transport system substrate-binding protein|uniref:ABC transporter substrate-binding protein n=1 Tax=Caldilinea sp. TaxID=2293560 RepID=UPI0021DDB31A|nr:ABC transporter substrate-binding protein [Caldilinea sp.]GIV70656.1 MAG: ABC transporter substrate-binding protein [Caldilinea sp.]
MRAHLQQHRLLIVLFTLIALMGLAGCALPVQPVGQATGGASADASQNVEPIYIGVSGPLTGPNARYGEQWIKGFDLALEEINGAGGVHGRPLAYIFEDSQSDPKQSVVVAQKFVADPRIIVELGDFASPASMAASPIYQRGGLVQFGFTNSHPDFTKGGGEYTWSNSVTQAQAAPALAEYTVVDLGLDRLAVFYLNTDWGKSTFDLYARRAEELGATIVAAEAYLPEEKDFRSALTRARDANPNGLVLISYQADGALIAQQIKQAGLDVPIVGAGSLQSPDFLKLGGDAVEGVYIQGQFLPTDPRPHVKNVVDRYVAKYNETPDFFAIHAYDTMKLIAQAIELGGPTREGVLKGLYQLKDVPSVIYEKANFDPETRRVVNPQFVNLQVVNGEFVLWDGVKPEKK